MSANFDMTCVLAPQNLQANSVYEYQAGWLFADSELEAMAQQDASVFEWPEKIYSFKSGSADLNQQRSYVVGSCRYLLKTALGNIFDDRGDKTFKSILNQHTQNPLDGIVMMGDQIYADDLNLLFADTKLAEFLARYRAVFSQDYIRAMMSAIPTYMILDDHEIEDNWPAKANEKDRITTYPNAIHAYQIYQCSHSPLFDACDDGRIDGVPQKFWYTFTDGCSDWFVLDARTERTFGNDKKMISGTQLNALLAWIGNPSTKIKIIVSSVPLAPDLVSESGDKWAGFSAQREIIFDAVEKSGNKIVFVSGDVHCSFTADIKKGNKTIAYQIVSSSFFWPYPHARKMDFADNKILSNGNQSSRYRAVINSPVFSDDNFARLDITPDKVLCSFYERKGGLFGQFVCAF